MKTIYLIRSSSEPARKYTGITDDVATRISDHNAGKNKHTRKFKPWTLVAAITLADERKALEFEKYLKTGSGRAFAERHFW
ncbi:MAG: GIY-YIG nuclease family protein [Planctomycetota bacterium]|jgi:predicted GIY-YIG superfamily endonuclease